MKGEYFIFLFIVLVITVAVFNIKTSEGFQPTLHVPESPVAQRNLVEGTDEYLGESLYGPLPGSIASVNSLPYKDPASEKAPYKRILNLQTTLNGFLENAGSSLKDTSDPSIQLPYTSSQGDNQRLKNEILVLKRNPGIESSLTQGDVDEIEANLAYLQKKYNLSVYSSEGFQNPGKQRASLAELNTLISKLNAAKVSLSSSGTTDPVVQGRINVLGSIQSKVQAIIDDVNSGARQESQIPIYEKSYQEFLKVITNNNSPLPKLLGETAPGLADLFPAYSVGDASGAQFTQYLFNKYADILFKGLSWDFSMSYTSEATQENNKDLINALNNSLGSMFSSRFSDNENSNPFMWQNMHKIDSYDFSKNTSASPTLPGKQNGSTSVPSTVPPSTAVPSTDAPSTCVPSTPVVSKPVRFDWHERANYICEAVAKHGLDPGDFGCLSETDYVSDNFSWRGYAKMVCSRLATSYDPGLPETCGCPPLTWSGWRAII